MLLEIQRIRIGQREKELRAGIIMIEPDAPKLVGEAVEQRFLQQLRPKLGFLPVFRLIRIQKVRKVIIRSQHISLDGVAPPAFKNQRGGQAFFPGVIAPALHLACGHVPCPMQVCDTQFAARARPLRFFKIESIPIEGFQNDAAIFNAAIHLTIFIAVRTCQPQGVIRAEPPGPAAQIAVKAVAQDLTELRRSVLVEKEIGPPPLRGHLAHLCAIKEIVVGLVLYSRPIGTAQ